MARREKPPTPAVVARLAHADLEPGRREVSISAINRAGVLRDLGPYNSLGRAGAPTLARSFLCHTPMPQEYLKYKRATTPSSVHEKLNTRQYEDPLAGGPGRSGWGYADFHAGVNFASTEFTEVGV
jgi:hypothetical protein